MKISTIILLSFLIILLLFSITTYINYNQSELVNENSESFARSTIVIRHSNRFQRNFLTMVSGLRGYLLTNEGFFIQTYDSAHAENKRILDEMMVLIPAGTKQRDVLDDIYELNTYWVREFAEPLLHAKKLTVESDSSREAFNKLYRGKLINGLEKEVQTSLQKKFAQFSNYEYTFRDTQKEKLTASIQNTKRVSFTLTAVSIVVGICIALFIAHFISSQIVKMVKMANAIADGNYEAHMHDQGNSELSLLAKALNNMAKILDTNISILKRQKEELDQFAHIVSHDIKAPLRGIDNVVTWIEEDHSFDLPPKVNEYLNLIKGRIIRAENLLKGILSYARVGKEIREKEVVDLNELLIEVQEYIPKKTGIVLNVQPEFPVLYTERIPLLQIFTNLIVNAFKYHDKEHGTVKVYYRSAGDHYEFFVEDDGPGIDPVYHEKIFIIFQTLQERDTFESTGVGLAIIKKILDDRGLSIKLVSASGKGSIFSFTWPKNEFKNVQSN
jgi:signal transduction histidine kinase